MDESLLELENELKRLRPRVPSAQFRAALDRELGQAEGAPPAPVSPPDAPPVPFWRWIAWSFAGAAALIAVTVQPWRREKPSPAAPVPAQTIALQSADANPEASPAGQTDRYEPVQATSVLYSLQEGEPTTLPDRTIGREVRYHFVDTYTWRNPATNASVRWNVPREEVRLVRANLD